MNWDYAVYIGGIRLPVPPEKLKTTEGANTYEYNVIELGDIIIPGTPKLRKYDLESFFPADTARFGCDAPKRYVAAFEGILDRKAPVELLILRMFPDGTPHILTHTSAVLTDFAWSDEFGSNDIPYTMKITEYRDIPVTILGV